MLIFPGMIADRAAAAGMKTPDPQDKTTFEWDFNDKKNAEEFPHFSVFCKMQLCRAMDPDEVDDNARVIASFTENEIKKVTIENLLGKGFRMKGF